MVMRLLLIALVKLPKMLPMAYFSQSLSRGISVSTKPTRLAQLPALDNAESPSLLVAGALLIATWFCTWLLNPMVVILLKMEAVVGRPNAQPTKRANQPSGNNQPGSVLRNVSI